MRFSLQTRVALGATFVLAGFLGFTGLSLDRALRESLETAMRERLQTQVYGLLAAADLDQHNRLRLPAELPEPRFARPDSGLYAAVDDDGQRVWSSRSTLGMTLPLAPDTATGRFRYDRIDLPGSPGLYVAHFAVTWEAGTLARRYHFQVAESLYGHRQQLLGFRHVLWGWLGAATLGLLIAQALILRWGLAPLRRVAAEIGAIETGQRDRMGEDYPRELRLLTTRLNQLVANSRNRLRRHRESLGNLAHSLKTPLAVIRSAVDSDAKRDEMCDTIRDQVERMSRTVDYQLQQAVIGAAEPGAATDVLSGTQRIVTALQKLYRDKAVHCSINIGAAIRFHGDEGDLVEILGNLIENAFKYCRQRVRISAATIISDNRSRLSLTVEDDGPGIPAARRDDVLRRGVRADETLPGHGIGLSVVHAIVAAYGGSLEVGSSSLGGAKVHIVL